MEQRQCNITGLPALAGCPYQHVGEKAARRDPRTYTAIACTAMKQVRDVAAHHMLGLRAPGSSRMQMRGLHSDTALAAGPPQGGRCALGDACPSAHNDWECELGHWLAAFLC